MQASVGLCGVQPEPYGEAPAGHYYHPDSLDDIYSLSASPPYLYDVNVPYPADGAQPMMIDMAEAASVPLPHDVDDDIFDEVSF